MRGRRLVAAADVVVVDRLAPRELLDELPADVEIIDCGKSAHRHNLTQDQINAVLVERARAGKRVVRLKGGDPFVFGRGGEEVLACVAAGVPVTVVPGVSSALAAPAAAGIPLTHRGLAADFTVVSGHLDPGRPPEDGMDWDYLANGPSTLVLLMAMDRLDKIARELIARGRDPRTPAAAIENATLPASAGGAGRRWPSSPTRSRAAGLAAPAVVVIGAVVDALGRLSAGRLDRLVLVSNKRSNSSFRRIRWRTDTASSTHRRATVPAPPPRRNGRRAGDPGQPDSWPRRRPGSTPTSGSGSPTWRRCAPPRRCSPTGPGPRSRRGRPTPGCCWPRSRPSSPTGPATSRPGPSKRAAIEAGARQVVTDARGRRSGPGGSEFLTMVEVSLGVFAAARAS